MELRDTAQNSILVHYDRINRSTDFLHKLPVTSLLRGTSSQQQLCKARLKASTWTRSWLSKHYYLQCLRCQGHKTRTNSVIRNFLIIVLEHHLGPQMVLWKCQQRLPELQTSHHQRISFSVLRSNPCSQNERDGEQQQVSGPHPTRSLHLSSLARSRSLAAEGAININHKNTWGKR